MGFDLFQSRRNFNERCSWWSREESGIYEEDMLVYREKKPSGVFYAKEANAEVQGDNLIGGIIMAEKTSVTIMSADDLTSLYNHIYDLKDKVLVEYQGQIWRVDSVQKRKARIQNSEFANIRRVSHYWYLSLIRG